MKFTNDFFSIGNTDSPDDFVQLVDSNSFETFIFKKVTLWVDGSSVIGKEDGAIFIRKGNTNYYYQRLFESSINIKWFGAKGDGVTNDTINIQKCIDTSYDLFNHKEPYNNDFIDNDLGGNFFTASTPIYFPKGKYIIKEVIILRNGTILKGENKNCVEFNSPEYDIVGFTTLRNIINGDYKMSDQIGIENITFSHIGIELYGAVYSYVKNCNFVNFTNITAILLKLSVNIIIEDIHIRDCTNSSGISILKDVGNGPNTTIKLNRIWMQYCKTGIYISSNNELGNALHSSSLTDSIIEYCDIGIYMEGKVNNFYINNIHFEMLEQAALVSTAIGTVSISEVWFDVNEVEKGNIILHSSNSSTVFQFYNVHSPIHIRQNFSGKVLLYGVANIASNSSNIIPYSYQ